MNKKGYKIVFVFLFVYIIAMVILFGTKDFKKENIESTIIVGKSSIWEKTKKGWANVYQESKINGLSWNKFHIYAANQYVGNYNVVRSDNDWLIFDDNKKSVNIDGSLLAYRAEKELKVGNFIPRQIDDYKYVKEVLRENGLNENQQYTIDNIVDFDIDSDGKNEEFYIISNAFSYNFVAEEIFSIVFMVKDSKIYNVYKNLDNKNSCKPYINAFIDIDNNGVYEMILSCGRMSAQKPIDMMYQLENNKFNVIISN